MLISFPIIVIKGLILLNLVVAQGIISSPRKTNLTLKPPSYLNGIFTHLKVCLAASSTPILPDPEQ